MIAPITIAEINPSRVYLNSCPNKKPLKNTSSTKPITIEPAIILGMESALLNSKKAKPPKSIGSENTNARLNDLKRLLLRPKFAKMFSFGLIKYVPMNIGIPIIK